MATTRNGWTTAPALRTAVSAPGCADTGEVRAGDVARIMQAFATAFDAEVEPLTTINGYRTPAYNASVGGDPNSNHLSATALDLNGARHPYERNLPASRRGANYAHGFTAAQVKAVRELLKRFGGVIAWGLDFNVGYRDAMHFEIRGTAADVARVAAQPIAPEDDMLTPAQENKLDHIIAMLGEVPVRVWLEPIKGTDGVGVQAWAWVRDTRILVGQLVAAGADVDEQALAAALAPLLPKAVAGLNDADIDELVQRLPDAVVDRLRARLV